jgi:hypothetical protein
MEAGIFFKESIKIEMDSEQNYQCLQKRLNTVSILLNLPSNPLPVQTTTSEQKPPVKKSQNPGYPFIVILLTCCWLQKRCSTNSASPPRTVILITVILRINILNSILPSLSIEIHPNLTTTTYHYYS